MTLDSNSLPADILEAAQAHFQAGDQRSALSLLLRGWLLQLIDRYGCRFRESDTEADCLKLVRSQTERQAHESFSRLIKNWQRVAYAHQATTLGDFERLISDWTRQWVLEHD